MINNDTNTINGQHLSCACVQSPVRKTIFTFYQADQMYDDENMVTQEVNAKTVQAREYDRHAHIHKHNRSCHSRVDLFFLPFFFVRNILYCHQDPAMLTRKKMKRGQTTPGSL